MPVRNIDEVVDALDVILDRAEDDGDRAGYFPALYRAMTVKVRDGIRAGLFEDGRRMDRLDTNFANRYLDAYATWKAGDRPTRAWEVAFSASRQREPTILQHLLLGINAHINLDLAIASAETSPGAQLPSLELDFDKINDILKNLTGVAQDAIDAHSPLLAKVDVVLGGADEAIAGFSIRNAREEAWSMAESLAHADGRERDKMLVRLDRRVATLGRLVASPGGLLGDALRLVRSREKSAIAAVIRSLRAIA